MAKKDFKAAINKTSLGEKKSGIGAVFASTTEEEKTVATVPVKSVSVVEEVPAELRQSFIVMEDDLEKLKDFVYLKKAHVDPFYSQKAALHDALELLFAQCDEIPSRPDHVKRMEQVRNESIKKKRGSK